MPKDVVVRTEIFPKRLSSRRRISLIFNRENFKYTPQTSAIYRFTQLFFIITNLPIPSTENLLYLSTTSGANNKGPERVRVRVRGRG
jgi:hypothetical protein